MSLLNLLTFVLLLWRRHCFRTEKLAVPRRSAGEGVIFREGSNANRSQRWVKEREPAR